MKQFILKTVVFTFVFLGFSFHSSSQIDVFNNSTFPEVFVKNESFSKISTKSLKSGFYIVRVFSDNLVFIDRIIKN